MEEHAGNYLPPGLRFAIDNIDAQTHVMVRICFMRQQWQCIRDNLRWMTEHSLLTHSIRTVTYHYSAVVHELSVHKGHIDNCQSRNRQHVFRPLRGIHTL